MGMLTKILSMLAPQKNVRCVIKTRSKSTVKRCFVPLWEERKWCKHGNEYSGYYRTPFGSHQGKIVEQFRGSFQFYIIKPPHEVFLHSHSVCFFPRKGNTYEIHFSKKAKTPDDGIMAIEKILYDAYQLPKGKSNQAKEN